MMKKLITLILALLLLGSLGIPAFAADTIPENEAYDPEPISEGFLCAGCNKLDYEVSGVNCIDVSGASIYLCSACESEYKCDTCGYVLPTQSHKAGCAKAPKQTELSFAPDTQETYTVTVPATLTAGGDAGTVAVSGKWATTRKLVVSCPKSIQLKNTVTDDYTEALAITFGTVSGDNDVQETAGNNRAEVSAEYAISVAQPTNSNLLGDWSGTITFTVTMANA